MNKILIIILILLTLTGCQSEFDSCYRTCLDLELKEKQCPFGFIILEPEEAKVWEDCRNEGKRSCFNVCTE